MQRHIEISLAEILAIFIIFYLIINNLASLKCPNKQKLSENPKEISGFIRSEMKIIMLPSTFIR